VWWGITKKIIWETNETNIYLLVRAKCVRCTLVVQAKESSLNNFLPEEVKRYGSKNLGIFLVTGLLAEHIGLSTAILDYIRVARKTWLAL
jgi:hypothetical protein